MDDSIRVLSGLVLAAGAVAALVRRRRPGASSLPLFLYATLLGFLAADKLIRFVDGLHEWLHARGLSDPPYLNGIDDLIYLALGGVVLLLTFHYRHFVFAGMSRWLCVTSAALLFSAAFMIDAFGPAGGAVTTGEQLLELGGAIMLSIAATTQTSGLAGTRARKQMKALPPARRSGVHRRNADS